MLGLGRLREDAGKQVEKVRKRAKPPSGMSWKVAGYSLAGMAFTAGGLSINTKTSELDLTRFVMILAPMVAMLYLFAKANREGRWLAIAGILAALVFSGAPSSIFEGKSNGEQAWVAFGSVSQFTAGLAGSPFKAWIVWTGARLAEGVALIGSVLPG